MSFSQSIDITVQASQRRIGLQLFLEESLVASGLGVDAARIRSFPVAAGAYRLVVSDLGANAGGGTFQLSVGQSTSRVIRTTATGYLVGAPASDAATARRSWAVACEKWQSIVFAVAPGRDSEIELVDCGEPGPASTGQGGPLQVESASRVVVVVDARPDGSGVRESSEHSTSGDTRATGAEAHSAWMEQCFVDMLAETDLDRHAGHFVMVACTRPKSFEQLGVTDPDRVVGISDSSAMRKWVFEE